MLKYNNIEFTSESKLNAETFPPIPAKKVMPDWYKEMDNDTFVGKRSQYGDDWPTIKKCMPVQDFMTSGYLIRTTSEVELTNQMDPDGVYDTIFNSADPMYIAKHPHNQCPVKLNNNKYHYFKFNQPWIIKTPPGYSCFIYQPFYFFEQRFTILPAIVDTDQLDQSVSLPAINNLPPDEVHTLPPGTPLCVVYPFKRENWKHEVKTDHWKDSKIRMLLRDGYKRLFHSKKNFK